MFLVLPNVAVLNHSVSDRSRRRQDLTPSYSTTKFCFDKNDQSLTCSHTNLCELPNNYLILNLNFGAEIPFPNYPAITSCKVARIKI